MRSTCPNDLEPCSHGCHDSELCARWGSYSIIKYELAKCVTQIYEYVYVSEDHDRYAQQDIEGRDATESEKDRLDKTY